MSRQDAKIAKQRFFEPSNEADQIAHAVIGAAIEVHRHLGPGLLEAAYERALVLELDARHVSFSRQVPVTVSYKGHVVSEQRLDFVVDDLVVVELKSVASVSSIHVVQALSYPRAANLELALVINFNVPVLTQGIRRVVRPYPWYGAPRV